MRAQPPAIRLLAAVPLVLLLNGCAAALKMVGLVDPREEYLASELPKVQSACSEGFTAAAAYQAEAPEQRSVMGKGTGLKAASDALRSCRSELERLASASLADSAGEKTVVVPDPGTVTLEVEGAQLTLPAAYRRAFQLEAALRALPLDVCPERRGNIAQKGFAGSWEPLQVSLTDWRGADCAGSPLAPYVTSALPAATVTLLQGECPGARINVPDFELEGLGPQLARRWTTVSCQQSRRRADGTSALGAPETSGCEMCRAWVAAP
jgi:hypothetical protein